MPTRETNNSANVWYKNYMVLVFVIGLPALVVIVCLFFIFYSIKIQDSTVRDDWYMDGKTLYQDASRDKMSHDLGITGIMRLSSDGDDTQVRFELNYPSDSLSSGKFHDGTPLTYPRSLAVRISHATDNDKDRDFTITHSTDNVYTGKVTLDPTPAKYYVQISNDGAHNWRLVQHEKFPVQNIAFRPLSSFDKDGSTLPDQRDKRAHLENKAQ
ncbi:FixH family protein [Moraxella sp. FZLJ2107]|uniref:FixH family protein n=1 Tax=unclassified Moraxella TaxID=2685852 RepID=UPI0020C8DD42|nr:MULTISPECIES: FixH family protein [unclassified Moraxella]UTO05107.1 FixH family protein [Moraxella sp. FZLJ2107]UTO21842.1 FixH family protein [Moraxella sp. FZLJ2109]